MFGSYIFPMSRKNELGLTYKQVLTPAIKEIERLLRNNILYDVVPAGQKASFNPTEYEEIIWIEEDGTMRRSKSPAAHL
jgi:hypothetical protein